MVEKDIRAHVAALDEAYAHNDAEAYFAHFAEDATILVPGVGRWTKADYADKWKATLARGGGVEASEVLDLKVQLSPAEDAAVVSYVHEVTYRGLYPHQPADHREEKSLLITEVWFRRDGAWLIAHMDWSALEQH